MDYLCQGGECRKRGVVRAQAYVSNMEEVESSAPSREASKAGTGGVYRQAKLAGDVEASSHWSSPIGEGGDGRSQIRDHLKLSRKHRPGAVAAVALMETAASHTSTSAANLASNVSAFALAALCPEEGRGEQWAPPSPTAPPRGGSRQHARFVNAEGNEGEEAFFQRAADLTMDSADDDNKGMTRRDMDAASSPHVVSLNAAAAAAVAGLQILGEGGYPWPRLRLTGWGGPGDANDLRESPGDGGGSSGLDLNGHPLGSHPTISPGVVVIPVRYNHRGSPLPGHSPLLSHVNQNRPPLSFPIPRASSAAATSTVVVSEREMLGVEARLERSRRTRPGSRGAAKGMCFGGGSGKVFGLYERPGGLGNGGLSGEGRSHSMHGDGGRKAKVNFKETGPVLSAEVQEARPRTTGSIGLRGSRSQSSPMAMAGLPSTPAWSTGEGSGRRGGGGGGAKSLPPSAILCRSGSPLHVAISVSVPLPQHMMKHRDISSPSTFPSAATSGGVTLSSRSMDDPSMMPGSPRGNPRGGPLTPFFGSHAPPSAAPAANSSAATSGGGALFSRAVSSRVDPSTLKVSRLDSRAPASITTPTPQPPTLAQISSSVPLSSSGSEPLRPTTHNASTPADAGRVTIALPAAAGSPIAEATGSRSRPMAFKPSGSSSDLKSRQRQRAVGAGRRPGGSVSAASSGLVGTLGFRKAFNDMLLGGKGVAGAAVGEGALTV